MNPIGCDLLWFFEPVCVNLVTAATSSWELLTNVDGEYSMAFDRIKSEIYMLLNDMENRPQDKWELHEMILEKLNELRAFGLPLPQDLVELEEKLSAELKVVPNDK